MSRRGGEAAAAASRARSASVPPAPPASPSSSAPGTRPLKIRSPCASPARSPAPSISAVSAGSVNRRGVPAAPSVSSSWRASVNRPARARCRTAATAFAASTLTVADGRSTVAIAVIASAGESTYSSTLWQMTRSAAFGPATLSRLAASPCTAVSRAPASAARRCAAASAAGLGATTVTLWPRAANGPASPPVPPPTSMMSSACLPVSAARAETTSRSTSHTREKRTPSRLKSAATPASFQESNLDPRAGGWTVTLRRGHVNLGDLAYVIWPWGSLRFFFTPPAGNSSAPAAGRRMLFAMAEHLELPRPWRLMLTAGWNLAESLGLPVAGYFVGAELGGRDAGMLAATGVVWLTVTGRKVITRSVPGLLTISALVLTLQTAVVIVTGSVLFFLLQFPLANLGLCVLFARTAPTRKPLVAQLAAEVVALRQPSAHYAGLQRFFQGATWLWAGIFAVSTVGLAVLMAIESVKVFLLLTTIVTVGGTVAGTFLSAFWFVRVLHRFGLRVRFAQQP